MWQVAWRSGFMPICHHATECSGHVMGVGHMARALRSWMQQQREEGDPAVHDDLHRYIRCGSTKQYVAMQQYKAVRTLMSTGRQDRWYQRPGVTRERSIPSTIMIGSGCCGQVWVNQNHDQDCVGLTLNTHRRNSITVWSLGYTGYGRVMRQDADGWQTD